MTQLDIAALSDHAANRLTAALADLVVQLRADALSLEQKTGHTDAGRVLVAQWRADAASVEAEVHALIQRWQDNQPDWDGD